MVDQGQPPRVTVYNTKIILDNESNKINMSMVYNLMVRLCQITPWSIGIHAMYKLIVNLMPRSHEHADLVWFGSAWIGSLKFGV